METNRRRAEEKRKSKFEDGAIDRGRLVSSYNAGALLGGKFAKSALAPTCSDFSHPLLNKTYPTAPKAFLRLVFSDVFHIQLQVFYQASICKKGKMS